MVQRVATVAFEGIEARAVDVQVQVAPGLPAFNIVGLPDKAVSEAKERVRSALIASGLALPARRITVNLAPADLPKEGSHYDPPIALGLSWPDRVPAAAPAFICKARPRGARTIVAPFASAVPSSLPPSAKIISKTPAARRLSRSISNSSRALGSRISPSNLCCISRDGRSPTEGTSISFCSGMDVTTAHPNCFLIFSASARGVRKPTATSLVK